MTNGYGDAANTKDYPPAETGPYCAYVQRLNPESIVDIYLHGVGHIGMYWQYPDGTYGGFGGGEVKNEMEARVSALKAFQSLWVNRLNMIEEEIARLRASA